MRQNRDKPEHARSVDDVPVKLLRLPDGQADGLPFVSAAGGAPEGQEGHERDSEAPASHTLVWLAGPRADEF